MELKTQNINEIKFNNNRFSLTNGRVFLLGILEENAVKDKSVFKIIDGLNDKSLFNPLFAILKANNQLLSPKFQNPISHYQSYQIEEDVLYRSTTYVIDDIKITIDSERFIDNEDNIIYMQYRFMTSDKINLDLYHGVDDTSIVPNLGVQYLKSKLHELTLKTLDGDYLALVYNKNFRHINRNNKNQPTEHYIIETEPNRTYTLTKVIGYGQRIRRLKKTLKYKSNQSYEKIKESHIQYKKNQLLQNKMTIVNNNELDMLLSYVYRQHFNNFPSSISLNQTGLEEYTQFIFYLYNKPSIAKEKLLELINKTIDYKDNAEILDYNGALVIENVDDFNLGNRVIYKGALLIYLINLYQQMTNDFSLIEEGALELSIEICKFYLDYGQLSKSNNHYDFNNVSNLDQSLNHINNHTFTNYLISNASKITKNLIQSNKKSKVLNKYSKSELNELIRSLSELHRKIFIQRPKENLLIYPYQNFPIDFERNLLEKDGNSLNILFDQLFLFIMFDDNFNKKIINSNIKYYSEHTKQSNLNQLLLNLVSSDIIKDEEYNQFIDSVSIFKESVLVNSKGIDFGLMGLVYIFMTYRLSGLRHDLKKFIVDSLIPKNIRRLEYDIYYRQYVATIKVKRNSARLDWKY